MSKRFNLEDGFIVIGFLATIVACQLLFHYWLKSNYFDWYLNDGVKISWAIAFLGFVWGNLNSTPSLISAHPAEYFGSYLKLAGDLFLLQAATTVSKSSTDPPIVSTYALDSALALLLNMILTVLLLAWMLVVMPIQYFLFVLCGAPARKIICSEQKIEGSETDWFTEELSQKPFSVTAAFSGMVLWAIGLLV